MRYAVRLDQSLQRQLYTRDIAKRVAPHLGVEVFVLERQLARPSKSILVRSNKRSAAEFIARWLRAYGVKVTVLEFANSTTIQTRRIKHTSLTILPQANSMAALLQ